MSISKILAGLISRLSGTNRSAPDDAAQAKLSGKDRDFLNKMLEGITAQVRHEQDMEAARGEARVVARLIPQVPVVDRDGGMGWFGGGARLAPGMAWPQIDAVPLQLLAQINCSRLPAGLWDGLGPRSGWLAIFLHPETLMPKVLHFDAPGDFKPSPPIGADCNFVGYDGRKNAEACGYTETFPRWPVTIEELEQVDESPDAPPGPNGRSLPHVRYAERHDFVAAGRWPFDWPSALAMIDTALAEFKKLLPQGEAPAWFAAEAIRKSARGIETAKASGADAETIAGLEVRHGEMIVSAEAFAYRLKNSAHLVSVLEDLKQRIDGMAARQPFSTSAIEPVLAELQKLKWMHKRIPPFYRDGNKLSELKRAAEGCEAFLLPLTTHDPAAVPTWVHGFETYLLDAAKRAYLSDRSALPPRLRADCEEMWRSRAEESMGGMGHVPWRYVHEFDIDEDATLLELPSSDLMGWQFGDVDNLVITIKKSDLARGDFSQTYVQISN